ncbi:uncharacterized protein LOC116438844 [Corvus moneduloides]|uniref:uncharacterized protein LOC116438844 n=1 Tax=Corvus moneduloides TaxID=1196302 RepID=UPI00136344E9|nr:uncharacterized protein LOC116438844 [Corvus moneduloides]
MCLPSFFSQRVFCPCYVSSFVISCVTGACTGLARSCSALPHTLAHADGLNPWQSAPYREVKPDLSSQGQVSEGVHFFYAEPPRRPADGPASSPLRALRKYYGTLRRSLYIICSEAYPVTTASASERGRSVPPEDPGLLRRRRGRPRAGRPPPASGACRAAPVPGRGGPGGARAPRTDGTERAGRPGATRFRAASPACRPGGAHLGSARLGPARLRRSLSAARPPNSHSSSEIPQRPGVLPRETFALQK